MVKTLEGIAAYPKTRRAMQEEEFAALNQTFWQRALAESNELKQKFGLRLTHNQKKVNEPIK